MRTLLSFLFSISFTIAIAQQPNFSVLELSLPKEIADYNNQFSGLYIHKGKLFLLSESRLQEKAEGKLYAIKLADLDRKIKDSAYNLPYKKYPIRHLETMSHQIETAGQEYEGLEAMIVDKNEVYFSVETPTPDSLCYLLKGQLTDAAVIMDTAFLVPLAKPVAADGAHIYNAGFESMMKRGDSIFLFFEYNYFPAQNFVYVLDSKLLPHNHTPYLLPISALPFRITDITATSQNHYTGINYFYSGNTLDSVYRVPATDTINHTLIYNATGYRNYIRLIDIEHTNNRFVWKQLWNLPEQYMRYNWEGVAAYKKGYFIINDKYTPKRPYQSTLLFLKQKKN